ncbi:MFS transporter [Buttiauxella sp. WJP83]|uniref:MFS transporter n=1 Tax=Buttiauxella sp. WJP83 TaxID=2986951 RepID=UPI0022DD79E2|nr:MFS transporter [Buttiauxella sp. WJP83]WBM72601.1 MFS transporter [Buttiauxella sp. WJP83]
MTTQSWYMTSPGKQKLLLLTIFLLTFIELLQAGMVAFASGPILGETGTSPQEYSFTIASYACVAIIMISKQRWIVERTGWRFYIAVSLFIFCIGSGVCSQSLTYSSFLAGRILMAIGGASFLTGARVMVNLLPPSPLRFSGVRAFATGLGAGTALAPFLASLAVSDDTWSGIFIILIGVAAVTFISASLCLPDEVPDSELKSQSHPFLLISLSAGAFTVLWVLQQSNYNFYSNLLILCIIAITGLSALYYFFSSMVRFNGVPLLMVKELFSNRRYMVGIILFSFCYLMIGLNNYLIPQLLQGGMGYSWNSIGTWYSVGLSSALVVWLGMSLVLPKRPGAKKFFVAGFLSLAIYAGLMSELAPDASLIGNILPALLFNGVFIMMVMATTAMQTFREVQHNETVFSHANQIKNMAAQFSTALGISIATVGMQWRETLHFSILNTFITPYNPAYRETLAKVSQVYANSVGTSQANDMALAWIAQQVKQQAIILASLDFYHTIFCCGLVIALIMGIQKMMR